MLTRTADSALPSLFEACHEEPYAAGSRGFGSWPATKYPCFRELGDGRTSTSWKVHNGKSILLTDESLRSGRLDLPLRARANGRRSRAGSAARAPDGRRSVDSRPTCRPSWASSPRS